MAYKDDGQSSSRARHETPPNEGDGEEHAADDHEHRKTLETVDDVILIRGKVQMGVGENSGVQNREYDRHRWLGEHIHHATGPSGKKPNVRGSVIVETLKK